MTAPRSMSELFDPEPDQWGLRGDPHVWQEMRRRLTAAIEPVSRTEGVRLLHSVFRDVVGGDLYVAPPDESLYKAEFDSGGMSGGHVHLTTWRERLMPLLESRLAAEH